MCIRQKIRLFFCLIASQDALMSMCLHTYFPPINVSIATDTNYCKSGNIRGTLIFANFAQNSASANSKTRENICDILYAHFGHRSCVLTMCVDANG